MEWEDIDKTFKDYERLCRRPPTTDELMKATMKAVEESRYIFDGYKIKGNKNE